MQFSILITTRNRRALLQRALESALAQTVACEIVIVDDASTDSTDDYIHGFKDRVIYRRNDRNLGHSAAMNIGVAIATGSWVKLVDDDDYLAPTCIEEMLEAIALHPQAVLCSCQAIQIDRHGHELGRTRIMGPGEVFYIPQRDIHYGMLLEQVPFGTPIQVAFDRQVFLQSGGWDSSLDTNCDDIDSWIRLAEHGDAIFINQPLAYRTLWNESRNKLLPLRRRFEANRLMKRKIYNRVAAPYRDRLPPLTQVEHYLQLYWSLVALKQRHVRTALTIAWPVIFFLDAWQMLVRVLLSRLHRGRGDRIQKIVLLNAPTYLSTGGEEVFESDGTDNSARGGTGS
jgi:glycosyltransferase involved in cell wall biosynthesis